MDLYQQAIEYYSAINDPKFEDINIKIHNLIEIIQLIPSSENKKEDNEKNKATKKDLNIEIANIKQTLDIVYKTMTQQECIINEYEKRGSKNFVKPRMDYVYDGEKVKSLREKINIVKQKMIH